MNDSCCQLEVADNETLNILTEAVCDSWAKHPNCDPELLGEMVWRAHHSYMKHMLESARTDLLVDVDPGDDDAAAVAEAHDVV